MFNNVVLIGMPGSGKSTIGKLLSEKLSYSFFDTDKAIELNENVSIEKIFQTKGESYFREKEKMIINDLLKMNKCIISTGGGMPVYFDNLNRLKEAGITIFINSSLEALIKRNGTVSNRPLLKNNVENNIRKLYCKRIDIYNQCDIIIHDNGYNAEYIAETIIKKLTKY
ncbi:MAG: shikimate kinase [Clostridiaceae bacterium]|jgi:shikimate kinase|nr:shikimate kinase [Clostridiaceae bacterium]